MKKFLLLAVFFALLGDSYAFADDVDKPDDFPDEINAYILKLADRGTPEQ